MEVLRQIEGLSFDQIEDLLLDETIDLNRLIDGHYFNGFPLVATLFDTDNGYLRRKLFDHTESDIIFGLLSRVLTIRNDLETYSVYRIIDVITRTWIGFDPSGLQFVEMLLKRYPLVIDYLNVQSNFIKFRHPFYEMIDGGNYQFCELLLRKGVNPSICPLGDGRTAIDMIRTYSLEPDNRQELIRLFSYYGGTDQFMMAYVDGQRYRANMNLLRSSGLLPRDLLEMIERYLLSEK